jgi:hypothetical protein
MSVSADHLLSTGPRAAYSCLAEYLLEKQRVTRFRLFEKPKPEQRVYFIGGKEGPVKIGVSLNPGQRLENLQTASPEPLDLLAVVPGGLQLERAYHEAFAHLRIRGEWFRRDEIMNAEIRYWSRRHRRLSRVWSLKP